VVSVVVLTNFFAGPFFLYAHKDFFEGICIHLGRQAWVGYLPKLSFSSIDPAAALSFFPLPSLCFVCHVSTGASLTSVPSTGTALPLMPHTLWIPFG